jgi:hypothetical protein
VEPVLFLPAIIDDICAGSKVYTIKILEYKECEDGFFDGILMCRSLSVRFSDLKIFPVRAAISQLIVAFEDVRAAPESDRPSPPWISPKSRWEFTNKGFVKERETQ